MLEWWTESRGCADGSGPIGGSVDSDPRLRDTTVSIQEHFMPIWFTSWTDKVPTKNVWVENRRCAIPYLSVSVGVRRNVVVQSDGMTSYCRVCLNLIFNTTTKDRASILAVPLLCSQMLGKIPLEALVRSFPILCAASRQP